MATGLQLSPTSAPAFQDARLEPVAKKVLAGERLDSADGVALYESHDLLGVGWLANYVREKRHGNVTYFNVNRHINPTNVCVAHCARRNLAARGRRCRRGSHGISYRRWPPS
jgi:aminodeoxyfutalosine synthase